MGSQSSAMSSPAQAIKATYKDATYEESLKLEVRDLVSKLVGMIGKTLTAYIAAVPDANIVDAWRSQDDRPSPEVEAKLRFAYRVAKDIAQRYSPGVAQAWLQGVNPELDDRVALRLIREGELIQVQPDILAAKSLFLEA